MNMLTKLRLFFISFLELLVIFLAYNLTKYIDVILEPPVDAKVFCIFIVLIFGVITAISGNDLAEVVYENMEIRNRKKGELMK